MIDVIHFYRSDDLVKVKAFYQDVLGLKLFKDQGSCLIYDTLGYGKIGFCTHHPKQKNDAVCITFVYHNKDDVDRMYESIKNEIKIVHIPCENKRFKIYHFFAQDFERNTVEFQTFLEE